MSTQKERVILGCMTFGPDPAKGGQVTTIEETKQLLDYFKSRGYNEIDSARAYHDGENESWLKQAGWKDHGFEVATKLYPLKPGMHKPSVIRENVELSLSLLGTDKLDIWYLHAPDRSVPFEETLEEVDKLYKEGKFTILGLSNYTAFEVAEICTLCRERNWVRPRIYQAMYNAITRAIESELVVACRRYGLDIVIYNPVGTLASPSPVPHSETNLLTPRKAGGFFSGKYRSKNAPTEGRFGCSNRGAAYRERYFRDAYFQALDVLEPVAAKYNIGLLETSLRWLVHHSALKMRSKGGNDGIIVGVSKLEQLQQNLDNLEKGPLPEELLKAVDEAWEICRPVCPNYWHLKLEYTSKF